MGRIDHVVVGVRDLDVAAKRILEEYGLEAQPGGAHSGAGTANMIVPVGNDQFLELLTITDSRSRHPIVRWLGKLVLEEDRLLALVIEPDDLDATAERLGEPTIEQDRVYDDGRRVGFRLTGVAGLLGPEVLPFFVETTVGRHLRCGDRPACHRLDPRGVRWVELGGKEIDLRMRIDDPAIPITGMPGRPGVHAVGLGVDGGEVVLRF
jgi:hypothetical protein